MNWRLIHNNKQNGWRNMALDKAMLTCYEEVKLPTLRFYQWEKPTLSLGYFQKLPPETQEFCIAHNITIVRRPTGGRAVLHDDEITYSIVAPYSIFSTERDVLKVYHHIAAAFSKAFQNMGLDIELSKKNVSDQKALFCFSEPSYYEISVGSKKLIGSAQRYYRNIFLQHGSLPITRDLSLMTALFGEEQLDKWTSLQESLGYLPDTNWVIKNIIHAMADMFDADFVESEFSLQEKQKSNEFEVTLYNEFYKDSVSQVL